MNEAQITEMSYESFVGGLVKPGVDILNSLTPEKMETLHYAVGISGEAGELLDAVKKYVVYNKDLDRENVVEELGDIEFFLEALRARLGIRREETILGNKRKLAKRYSSGKYSDKQAQERADKS